MAATSTTLNDLVNAAVSAYHKDNTPNLGPDWIGIDPTTQNAALKQKMDAVGYSGEAKVNIVTGEISIANRGTISLTDLYNDAWIGTHLVAQPAQTVANEFALAAISQANAYLATGNLSVTAVYFSGHSLGGEESQGQTVMLSNMISKGMILDQTVHITNVSVDGPGIGPIADKGDPNYYTSYNISERSDIIHYSGGAHLSGTIDLIAQSGPDQSFLKMISSEMNLTNPAFMGGALATYLNNALVAHDSVDLQNFVGKSSLSQITLEDLASAGPDHIQDMLGVSKEFYQSLNSDGQANLLAHATPPTPVYDANGYDQNGYDASGYTIYGKDHNGVLDPSIAQNPGITHYEEYADGTTVAVKISSDGSYDESIHIPGTADYQEHANADGDLKEATVHTSDGITTTSSRSDDGSLSTTSQMSDGNGGTTIYSRETNLDGSPQKEITYDRGPDGSSSATSVSSDGTIVKISTNEIGSKETDVSYSDGSHITTVDGGYGIILTTEKDADGTTLKTLSNNNGSGYTDTGTPDGTQSYVWRASNGVHGTDIFDRTGSYGTITASVHEVGVGLSGNGLTTTASLGSNTVDFSYSETATADGRQIISAHEVIHWAGNILDATVDEGNSQWTDGVQDRNGDPEW